MVRGFTMGIAGLFLAGCTGGMQVYDPSSPAAPDTPATVDFDPTDDPTDDWRDTGTPSDLVETLAGTVFRFEVSKGHASSLIFLDPLIAEIPTDLMVEVLDERVPMTDVRVGAAFVDVDPPEQDPCFATVVPAATEYGDVTRRFKHDFGGRAIDLGLPFRTDQVSVEGVFQPSTWSITEPQLTLRANASELGAVLFGATDPGHACEFLEKADLICERCEMGPCVEIVIDGFATGIDAGFTLEPLLPMDVAAHPDCH